MSHRAFAASFEQTITFAMTCVAELPGETASIEVRKARASDRESGGQKPNLGRFRSSQAGSLPSRQTQAQRPTACKDLAGKPGRFTIGLSVMIESTPVAR